jgi:hypothetical protein
MIGNSNILFDVRHHATVTEEFQFAIHIIAERILLIQDGERKPDIERGFKTINKILMKKVKEIEGKQK